MRLKVSANASERRQMSGRRLSAAPAANGACFGAQLERSRRPLISTSGLEDLCNDHSVCDNVMFPTVASGKQPGDRYNLLLHRLEKTRRGLQVRCVHVDGHERVQTS